MKHLILLFLLLPIVLMAKTNKETPVFFRFGYLHNVALGASHAYHNNNFFYGQGYNGRGVNVSVAIPLKNKWYVGFNYEPWALGIFTDRVAQQAYFLFDDDNHYTRVKDYDVASGIGMHNISFEAAYLLKTKFVELMPTIKAGIMIIGGSDEILNYSRKRQNSNYSERVTVVRADNSESTVFWCAGVRLTKRLSKTFGLTGALFYTGVPDIKVGYRQKVTDFLGHSWQTQPVTYKQPFHMFQFQLGITFSTWKGKRKRHEKDTE